MTWILKFVSWMHWWDYKPVGLPMYADSKVAISEGTGLHNVHELTDTSELYRGYTDNESAITHAGVPEA